MTAAVWLHVRLACKHDGTYACDRHLSACRHQLLLMPSFFSNVCCMSAAQSALRSHKHTCPYLCDASCRPLMAAEIALSCRADGPPLLLLVMALLSVRKAVSRASSAASGAICCVTCRVSSNSGSCRYNQARQMDSATVSVGWLLWAHCKFCMSFDWKCQAVRCTTQVTCPPKSLGACSWLIHTPTARCAPPYLDPRVLDKQVARSRPRPNHLPKLRQGSAAVRCK